MHKARFLFITLLFASLIAAAQDTLQMSLDSCIRYAYSHNISVRTAALDKESAVAALNGAKMNFLPSFNASASQSWNFRSGDGGSSSNSNCGLNGSLTLFNGLNNYNSYRKSEASLEQSELRQQQVANDVASQITTAYLTILMSHEKLNYQREVLRTNLQQKNDGELKYKIGKLLESDYMLLVANYQSTKANIENTLLTIENNQLALRSLLCLTNGEVIKTEHPELEPSQLPLCDTVVSRSLRSRPDLRISQLDVEIARYQVLLAQSSYYPTLGLSAGATYYGGSNTQVNDIGSVVDNGNINSSLTLSLNVPIFSRGSTLTKVKQSRIELQEAELQNSQAIIDLEKEVRGQYLATSQALVSYQGSKSLKEAYKASYEVYKLKYEQGIITTVELLQQQDKFLSAINDYLQDKYTFFLDKKVLDIYMGVQ